MPEDERTDARWARTHAALVATAIELVDARDTAAISVSDLARSAGVTRMTFYQHFADRDALLQTAGLVRFEGALADYRAQGPRSLEGAVAALFEHVTEHRDFYRRLLNGSCGLQTYRAIQTFFSDGIARAAENDGRTLDPEERLLLGGGGMAYLVWWLDDGAAGQTPPAAAARVARLLSRHIAAAGSPG